MTRIGQGEIGTERERRAVRRTILRQELRKARRQALITGRSPKCGGSHGYREPLHAGRDGGCANDGTTCICECHDPAGSTS